MYFNLTILCYNFSNRETLGMKSIEFIKIMYLLALEDFTQEINKLIDILNKKFFIIPKFGVEIEFYLRDKNKELLTIERIKQFKTKLKEKGFIPEEEKGLNQFEIQINYTSNTKQLLDKIHAIKSYLISVAEELNLKVLFNPKPFKNDYGSSMHFHLSLHDKNDHNIFSKETINSNKPLNDVVSGILSMLNQSLYFLCEDNLEEYDRFSPNFMSPVNVSWGGNNRTTAIRIPEGHINNRRIEFRIPSASCNSQRAIFFLLFASIYGMEFTSNTIDRIYGNAYDDQYHLTWLHNNPSDAKRHYMLDEMYIKWVLVNNRS